MVGFAHKKVDSLPTEPPGKSKNTGVGDLSLLQWILPDPEIKLGSPALQKDSFPGEVPGNPTQTSYPYISVNIVIPQYLLAWDPGVPQIPKPAGAQVSYEMAQYSHITYAHPPVHFKSSLHKMPNTM